MKYLVPILLILLVTSCNKNPLKVDVSDIHVEMEFNRFEKVLFESTADELQEKMERMRNLYPEFTTLYTEEIIKVGSMEDSTFFEDFKSFYLDTVIKQVADSALITFENFDATETKIIEGFKHLKYYFPQKPLPHIFTYLSGFNQSMVVGNEFIGINLDKYMGANCIFYKYLGIPQYKVLKMYPEKIASDLFYAYAITEFENRENSDNLLANILYQGKLMYFTEAMLPDTPDTTLIGYTEAQLDWVKENEAEMWTYLAERKLLYNLDRLNIQKFIGDAPFTNAFSNESPGRTGTWIGWQIIRSYMKNNPETTLEELMRTKDSQQLLSLAKYFPD